MGSGAGVVLVTGANGFLGRAVTAALAARGRPWAAAVRRAERLPDDALPAGRPPERVVAVGDLATANWGEALAGVDAVVHLAGPAHRTVRGSGGAKRLLQEHAEGTRRLVAAAREAGVRRVVLASSTKVLGEATRPDRPWSAATPPRPDDWYGLAKLAAENFLRTEAEIGGLEWSLVRLPLLYGAGVRGNLERLGAALRRGRPLPLGAVRNRRSLLGVRNAADLLLRLADHPAAAGRVFLARDWDGSTPDLVRALARGMGVTPRLWPLPPLLLRLSPVGRAALRRLVGSLVVDDADTRAALDWSPPVAPEVEWRAAGRTLAEAPRP